MRVQLIVEMLEARGERPALQLTCAGRAVGLPIPVHRGSYVWSLVPIDDELDERFSEFLLSEARRMRGATW